MVVFELSPEYNYNRSCESIISTWTAEIKKYRPDAPWILLGYDYYERMCDGCGVAPLSAGDTAEAKRLGENTPAPNNIIILYNYIFTDKQGLLHTLKSAVKPFSSKQRYVQFWIEKSKFNCNIIDISLICRTCT